MAFALEYTFQHTFPLLLVVKAAFRNYQTNPLSSQVVWLNWGLTPTDLATMPAGIQRGFSRDLILNGPSATHSGLGADLGDNKGACLCTGTWNADIYDPLKKLVSDDDVHCAKNRMSGMWSEEQPLRRYLNGLEEGKGKGLGKKTVLFAGVNTDQCVLGTLADAYNAGRLFQIWGFARGDVKRVARKG